MGKFFNQQIQYKDLLDPMQMIKLLKSIHQGHQPCEEYLAKIACFYADKKSKGRQQAVLLWLRKNNLVGYRLVEFFKNEGSFLDGMNTIVNFIEGRPRSKRTIKADEMLS